MALALGVHLNDTFYIGAIPVKVVELEGYARAVLELPGGQRFTVSDQQSVEILPTVFVSCGKPSRSRVEKHRQLLEEFEAAKARGAHLPEDPGVLLPRLLFEAPRSITILREELYRQGNVHHA